MRYAVCYLLNLSLLFTFSSKNSFLANICIVPTIGTVIYDLLQPDPAVRTQCIQTYKMNGKYNLHDKCVIYCVFMSDVSHVFHGTYVHATKRRRSICGAVLSRNALCYVGERWSYGIHDLIEHY